MPLPPVETLRQLLRYEPDTGKLYWLQRPASMFPNSRIANSWNSCWAGKEALTATKGDGYRHGAILAKYYPAHRVAWALHYGEWPAEQIDHINGDKADNRLENLRAVSRTDNMRNTKLPSDNSSGQIGVYWCERDKSWRAQIGIGSKKNVTLGSFKNFPDAVLARQQAEAALGYHSNHGRVQ